MHYNITNYNISITMSNITNHKINAKTDFHYATLFFLGQLVLGVLSQTPSEHIGIYIDPLTIAAILMGWFYPGRLATYTIATSWVLFGFIVVPKAAAVIILSQFMTISKLIAQNICHWLSLVVVSEYLYACRLEKVSMYHAIPAGIIVYWSALLASTGIFLALYCSIKYFPIGIDVYIR